MNPQKFLAPNVTEALKLVTQQLGGDAIVLTTRDTAQGVEIIAITPGEAAFMKPSTTPAPDSADLKLAMSSRTASNGSGVASLLVSSFSNWKPFDVRIGSDTSPTLSFSSSSFTAGASSPRLSGPISPPLALEGDSENSVTSLAKSSRPVVARVRISTTFLATSSAAATLITVCPFCTTVGSDTIALGTADLLGQMAAPDYIAKLPVLFDEFAEAQRSGIGRLPATFAFASAESPCALVLASKHATLVQTFGLPSQPSIFPERCAQPAHSGNIFTLPQQSE